MEYWPFWASGLALAAVAVGHALLTQRLMAVSGRFTALVNRLRHPGSERELEMTEAELVAAVAQATRETYGDAAVGAPEPLQAAERSLQLNPQSTSTHVIFFVALIAGGLISALLAGFEPPTASLRSEAFSEVFGSGPLAWLVLVAGGVLVGFGTRMAGGCTSGHGLCGVSRLQPGSLLATLAFFGSGIATALLIGVLR